MHLVFCMNTSTADSACTRHFQL